jgi:hypothetical protein
MPHMVMPHIIVMYRIACLCPQGATKVHLGASDDAKLAATLVALGEQMLALGRRLEAQQTIPASL